MACTMALFTLVGVSVDKKALLCTLGCVQWGCF